MKKKLLALICAAVLCMALPGMAFADNPSQQQGTTSPVTVNGTTLTVSGNAADLVNLMVVPANEHQASNTPANANVFATYRVYYSDGIHNPDGTLTFNFSFNVGQEYNGYIATVYVEHEVKAGATDVKTAVVQNGAVSISTDQLSYFTICLDPANAATDGSAISPKTGVDFAGYAAVAGIALLGAGAAFFVRRKMN